jgi:exoribonuclease II
LTGTIPMFPWELAAGPMSLVGGKDRESMSIGLRLDPTSGDIVEVKMLTSLIRVRSSLTYRSVDEVLKGSEAAVEEPLREDLLRLHEIGKLRAAFRRSRGSSESFGTDCIVPDLNVTVTKTGQGRSAAYEVQVGTPRGVGAAQELVMEMMVAANEAVGRFAAQNDIPMLYRGQAPPQVFGGGTVAEVLDELPLGLPRNYAMRRFFMPSQVTTKPIPHAGLGVAHYVQFTSPIRRFSDLVCHYQIKAYLRGEPPRFDLPALKEIGKALAGVGIRSRIAKDASRYWVLQHLRQDLSARHRGLILGPARKSEDHLTVLLLDVALEVTVYAPELTDAVGREVLVQFTSMCPRSVDYEAVVMGVESSD